MIDPVRIRNASDSLPAQIRADIKFKVRTCSRLKTGSTDKSELHFT